MTEHFMKRASYRTEPTMNLVSREVSACLPDADWMEMRFDAGEHAEQQAIPVNANRSLVYRKRLA